MKIIVFDKIKELDVKTIRASKLLKELGIPAPAALVVKNDTIVCEDETLTENDKIEILKVISGG